MASVRGVTKAHIKSVTEEVAGKAGISMSQAAKVLSLLHIEKLPEQSRALLKVIDNPIAVQALGYSSAHVTELRKQLEGGVSLANLRVGIKNPGMHGAVMV